MKINELLGLIKKDYKKYGQSISVDELIKVLKKSSDVYYNTGQSILSDFIYDELKDILEQRDPDNPFLDEIGAPVKGTKEKIQLPFPMGSLTKIKPDFGDLDKWSNKFQGPYIISDKLDGASAQIYKDFNGNVFLYSRGNGSEGQDISHLIQYVINKKSIELMPIESSIRGELIISIKDFKKISSYMKNARNAVAGLTNSKTVDKKIANITNFVAYAILNPRYKQSDQMNYLKKWKFDTVEYKCADDVDIEYLKTYLLERKSNTKYEMDGIVCIDDSKIYQHKGGYPEHAFAFKMLLDDQIITATVVQVLWEISMDGYVKPRIEIKPIDLGGTTITYATAFNAKYIVDNKIGKGSKIKLVRSGDVIPYILEIISPSKTGPQMPEFEYVWNESGIDILVKNIDGDLKKAITTKLIIYFFEKIGVKYMSEGIITKLVDNGYNSIPKILNTDQSKLYNIDGLGVKVLTKIYSEIDRAFEEIELATFMGASRKFGRGLAIKKIQEILTIYPNILNEKWTKDEMIEKILEVHGFSDKLSNLFADNFKKFMNFYDEIAEIKDISRFKLVNKLVDKKGKLNDEKIVFTGFRDNKLEKLIIDNGGKVSTTVSSNTTILIHKDGADKSSSKFTKAEKIGTKIMSYSEFIKKYKIT